LAEVHINTKRKCLILLECRNRKTSEITYSPNIPPRNRPLLDRGLTRVVYYGGGEECINNTVISSPVLHNSD
jgi:hypothetical protein